MKINLFQKRNELKLGAVEILIGPILFFLSVLLRKYNILLFRYEEAFGHQAWNTEFFARKHFVERGRWPLMVGFERFSPVANIGLLEHHKKSRLTLIRAGSLLNKLFRYGRGYQQAIYGSSWSHIGHKAIATATMSELHTDECLHYDSIAFPVIGKQREKAIEYLNELGLQEGKYYCFHDRGREREGNVGIDQYRITTIDSLFKGVEELNKRKITAVRVGIASGGEWTGPPIVDYAGKYREEVDDFADIALLTHCKFFVGPGSGIQMCVNAFNRPVCLINAFPWPWTESPMREGSVVIPKKYWVSDQKRFLTIREMVELENKFEWKNLYKNGFLEQLGLEVIANTSEEIVGAMIEINDRIDGCWDGLEYPVKDILKPHNMASRSRAYMGSTFIELNDKLVD